MRPAGFRSLAPGPAPAAACAARTGGPGGPEAENAGTVHPVGGRGTMPRPVPITAFTALGHLGSPPPCPIPTGADDAAAQAA